MPLNELPGKPYRDFGDLHTSPERPFGPLYTNSDYAFLARASGVMHIPPTYKERVNTRNELRRIKTDNERDASDKFQILAAEVKIKGGFINRSNEQSEVIHLGIAGRNMEVGITKDRTTLTFPPNSNVPFEYQGASHFAFESLPLVLWGDTAPDPRKLREYTTATFTVANRPPIVISLNTPSNEERFKELMNNPDSLYFMTLNMATPEGLSFKIGLPNLRRNPNSQMYISVPAFQEFSTETMELLLGMHKNATASAGEDLAERFASIINSARKTLIA